MLDQYVMYDIGWANDGVCFKCGKYNNNNVFNNYNSNNLYFSYYILIKTANPSTNKKRRSKWSSKNIYELCINIFRWLVHFK